MVQAWSIGTSKRSRKFLLRNVYFSLGKQVISDTPGPGAYDNTRFIKPTKKKYPGWVYDYFLNKLINL